ncbi:hypothetical protein Taro_045578, partial [Colocasia esculenta]|nr:hypothetical protein [Colocasia esculenta]
LSPASLSRLRFLFLRFPPLSLLGGAQEEARGDSPLLFFLSRGAAEGGRAAPLPLLPLFRRTKGRPRGSFTASPPSVFPVSHPNEPRRAHRRGAVNGGVSVRAHSSGYLGRPLTAHGQRRGVAEQTAGAVDGARPAAVLLRRWSTTGDDRRKGATGLLSYSPGVAVDAQDLQCWRQLFGFQQLEQRAFTNSQVFQVDKVCPRKRCQICTSTDNKSVDHVGELFQPKRSLQLVDICEFQLRDASCSPPTIPHKSETQCLVRDLVQQILCGVGDFLQLLQPDANGLICYVHVLYVVEGGSHPGQHPDQPPGFRMHPADHA